MTKSYHQEGEAIAGYTLNHLGPKWKIACRGDRNRWEIRNVLDPDLIFGSYSLTDQGWTYKPNPSIPGPTKANIDWAIEQGMKQAIAPQSHTPI